MVIIVLQVEKVIKCIVYMVFFCVMISVSRMVVSIGLFRGLSWMTLVCY